MTVEHLLSTERPFLADALELIEKIPHEKLTPHARNLKKHILARLQDTEALHPGGAPTLR